jgi:hypothetical protein
MRWAGGWIECVELMPSLGHWVEIETVAGLTGYAMRVRSRWCEGYEWWEVEDRNVREFLVWGDEQVDRWRPVQRDE